MSAFSFEYEHARLEGVKFLWYTQPARILSSKGSERVEAIALTRLQASGDDAEFTLPADLVVLAIGQGNQTALLGPDKLQVERGRIVIDRVTGQTSNPKFFAGGDCTNGGREVVDAVADGKRAGIGIAAFLEVPVASA